MGHVHPGRPRRRRLARVIRGLSLTSERQPVGSDAAAPAPDPTWPNQRDATVISDRTHRNAKHLERWLIEQHGEDYAAVVTRAGTVRGARLRGSGAQLTKAQKARNDGLEEGLLLAGCVILKRSGMTHGDAERSAKDDITRMSSAIEQDEHEFLNDPAWQRPPF